MERITAGDDVSSLEITWFNNPYAAQKLELGREYYFQGIVTGGMLRRQMVNPQVRTEAQITAAPFEAVYPQTDGLSSSVIARCVRQLLPHAELLPDPLPEEMRRKYRLPSKAEAVRAIHCPATEEQAAAARRRSSTASISLSVTAGVTHSTLKPEVWASFSSGCRAVVAVATKPSSFFTLTRS